MKILGTIENREIIERDDLSVMWFGPLRIDCDGSDNRHNDPCWQADTTLRHEGHAIDAEAVSYIVVPPMIVRGVRGVVMGCQGRATNTSNGLSIDVVVADVGPRLKLGEASCECARRLGLDGNPNHGGTEACIIRYEIFPGVPAVVDAITYDLQHS